MPKPFADQNDTVWLPDRGEFCFAFVSHYASNNDRPIANTPGEAGQLSAYLVGG